MLVIRLSRMGSKKRPFLRIVVTESRRPRDSRFVENLGYYRPKDQPATVLIDQERAEHWIKMGARPSDTVRSLLAKYVPPAGATPPPARDAEGTEASAG
jgi:small subunit ribosomal protein S16